MIFGEVYLGDFGGLEPYTITGKRYKILAKTFLIFLKFAQKQKKKFGEGFSSFYFLLEIDLLFRQKNGTKPLEPPLLFLYRTAALFTRSQNF